MKRFVMDHGMMSVCLMDGNFYESVPDFKPLQGAAQREYDIRRASIENGSKSGCSSCGKKRSAKVKAELARRHGALFSQHVSTKRTADPVYEFTGLVQYVRDHVKALTLREDAQPDFDTLVVYIPMKNIGGAIEVREMEI